MRSGRLEAIEQVDWTRYIEDLKEYIEYTEARLDRLRVSPIAETSSPKHRAALLESLRDVVTKTREQIKDREANVRAKAIGPCPDLGELFGIYDTRDEAFDVLYAWFDAVWELPKPQREAMLGRAEDHLTCGSAPSEQTEWDPGSFAEQRWEWFKHNPEGFRANYGEKIYRDYVVMASEAEEEKAEAKHAATGSERRSNTDYQYWFERDWDTDNPIALLRCRGGYMTTWNSKEQEWRPSVRSVPELDGLGGATNFRSIDAESAGRVKEYLDRVNLNE